MNYMRSRELDLLQVLSWSRWFRVLLRATRRIQEDPLTRRVGNKGLSDFQSEDKSGEVTEIDGRSCEQAWSRFPAVFVSWFDPLRFFFDLLWLRLPFE